MIFLLVKSCLPWLEAHHLGFLRVFTFVTFQAMAAIVMSFTIVVAFGPPVIAWLRRQKIGDRPEFDQVDINKMMEGKKGTPTMGGLLIISAIGITTMLLVDLYSHEANFYAQMAMVCLIWLGGVGAIDDWLKLTAGRRAGSRQGLTTLEKLLFQIGLGIVLGIFTYNYGRNSPPNHTLYLPFLKGQFFELNLATFVIITTLVLTGTSNAVNLTDGLDGLAAGCMGIVSFTFFILALIAGTTEFFGSGRPIAAYLYLPYIPKSDQMAVIAGSMTGACMGFLWFNCNPAQVFMGDTGSLALGGLIAYISIVIRQELILFLVGGIFVIEAMSVIIQVSYFKYSRRKFGEGRRIFLMSPLHHHFQRKGWSETQVVVRFWLIGAMLAALALATVKLR